MTLTRSSRKEVESALGIADVRINGGRPWDLVVHDDRFYTRVISGVLLA